MVQPKFEKQVFGYANRVEVIMGTIWRLGSLETSVSLYPLIRCGIMASYFDGYIRQFSAVNKGVGQKKSKWQAYLVLRPEAKWVLINASIEPGIFSSEECT